MQADPSAATVGDSGVHYDIPARVFELLLDPNMNYSSGIYPRGDEDLEAAQVAKMDRIASLLALGEGKRVLDIGCGWGGPACYLARHYDCEVVGITLSAVQKEAAEARARSLAVQRRVHVQQCDVLDMCLEPASFDSVIFLESIIHMPDKTRIFKACESLLIPGGLLFIQESNYDCGSRVERYRSERGFAEVNEAFGGTATMLSAGEMFCRLEECGLVPQHLEDISVHYQRTLMQWLDNLDRHREPMRAISERAHTMLRRYLMIALQTYRSGHTVCHQMSARKPA